MGMSKVDSVVTFAKKNGIVKYKYEYIRSVYRISIYTIIFIYIYKYKVYSLVLAGGMVVPEAV